MGVAVAFEAIGDLGDTRIAEENDRSRAAVEQMACRQFATGNVVAAHDTV